MSLSHLRSHAPRRATALAGGLVLAALVAVGTSAGAEVASAELRVRNGLDFARPGETVEVRARALAGRFAPGDLAGLVVTDARGGAPLVSQALDEDGDGRPDLLVFQADFAGGETRSFTLTRGLPRKARREDYRVYGRFVRERQDDFAWENDRVAFRAYGPALETFAKEPLTSSAIDAWSKSTRQSRVLASGPIRLVFELVYPAWEGGLRVLERKRVTLDAGSQFNRFDSVYTLDEAAPGTPVTWAAGVRRAEGAASRIERERGIARTWEYQGRYGDGGHLGCAVVMDPAQVVDVTEAEGSHLVVARTPASRPATYFAGSGWDRGGRFPDAAAWDRHVEAFARRVASPLEVELVP